jgi:hypothetical protein
MNRESKGGKNTTEKKDLVGAAGFELATPCAQGIGSVSISREHNAL